MSKLSPYHPHLNDAALERILAAFDASFMSDAKWVRLLDTLSASPEVVLECRAKLVWDDNLRLFRISDAQYGFDYYDKAVEALISGPPAGWYQYREIEWLEFPRLAALPIDEDNRQLGMRQVQQDLSAIRARIEQVGSFELNDEDGGLRLYAYRRQRA